MHGYIDRTHILGVIKQRLKTNPAVALLGARQVGKSTLAKQILQQYPNALYLDLEKPSDLNKLTNPEVFFTSFNQSLICLDEIQRVPEIFPILRSIIDQNNRNTQFLILGPASRDLIKQSSESLAGRLSYLEITPFDYAELPIIIRDNHWTRGGYPRSLLADDEEVSYQWREDYIRTFLERDIPQLGFQIPAATMSRLWQMLAHSQGQILNTSKLAGSMGVSSHTIRKYIDLLEQTFMLRILQPYASKTKKRLVKSPKIYIRDTGILHTLLGIENTEILFGHPVYGASYEAYIIENVVSQLPQWKASYYRTSNGAEIDLILEKAGQKIAIEIKASNSPTLTKGFWSSLETIKANKVYVIAQVEFSYPISEDVTVISLAEFIDNWA